MLDLNRKALFTQGYIYKWLTFCRRHFHMRFLSRICVLVETSLIFVPEDPTYDSLVKEKVRCPTGGNMC